MEEQKRILFNSKRNSGGGHYIKQKELMKHLAENRYSVSFMSPGKCRDLGGITDLDDVQVTIPKIDYLSHLVSVGVELYIKKYDMYVTFKLLETVVGSLLKVAGVDVSVIWFVRNDIITGKKMKVGYLTGLVAKIMLRFEKIALKRADKVVFISENLKKTILSRHEMFDKELVSVLYNNVYTPRVRKYLNEDVDLDGQPKIGFVGRIRRDGGKGTRYLVDASVKLANNYERMRVFMVGNGTGRKRLEKYCKERGVFGQVVFTGWVENPIKYIREFDVMVLPSLHEALGNCLMEALAVGTPVAASNVGGIPEVINVDKYLFRPKCGQCIADTVANMLDPHEYEQAREYMEKRRNMFDFSWVEKAEEVIVK